MDVEVITAVTGDADSDVAAALARTPGVTVRRRCADLAELIAAADAGLGTLAVVSAELAWLDREVVRRLRSLGIKVLALVDPAEPWQRERMLALGVDAVVDEIAQISAAVTTWSDRNPDVIEPEPTEPEPAWLEPETAGRMIAVWGPAGAPGRTTVAVNLAAEVAARGSSVLLIDADTYGGAVAQALAMLDEAPGLAAACRQAAGGSLEPFQVARLAPSITENWRVLTGISRASRWPEIGTGALEEVWAAARRVADYVIVDTGFSLETDEALTYDTYAPQRNGATLSALAAAEEVVVVGRGDVVGLARLLSFLASEDVAKLPTNRRIVINQVRPDLGGKDVPEVAGRYGGVQVDVLIPADPLVEEARFRGVTLAEVKPGPALAAVRTLADVVAPSASSVPDETGEPVGPQRRRDRRERRGARDRRGRSARWGRAERSARGE